MINRYYWLCLLGSIVFEVAGTTIMKLSQEAYPLIGMGIMYTLLGFSYFFLAKAVLKLPVGVAFAFWEGLGLVLITLSSVLLLGERIDFTRIMALAMVLAGTLLVHHGTDASPSTEDAKQSGNSVNDGGVS